MRPFPLRPDLQALLIVDMQNDFVRVGAPQEVPTAREIVPSVAGLAEAFRRRRRPVIYTRFLAGPAATLITLWSPECGADQRSCWLGHQRSYSDVVGPREGPGVIDELAPRRGELVIDKYGYGAFHNTMLGDVLRALSVSQVVVTGVVTQICVEDTVRQGMQLGLEMVLVRDGVASFDADLHNATLRNVEMKFGVVTDSGEVLALTGDGGEPVTAHSA